MIFNVGIGLGVVLGFALGITLTDLRGFVDLPSEAWAFIGALFGSVLAVIGALFVVRIQLNARSIELEKNRDRKRFAAIAILASDLSQIIAYTNYCIMAAEDGSKSSNGDKIVCPNMEPEILTRLERLVELLNSIDADQVVDLLHCLQIQHSRLSSEIIEYNDRQRSGSSEFGDWPYKFQFTLLATLELYLRAENMFSFARRLDETIETPPFSKERVERLFIRTGVEDWLSDRIRNEILDDLTALSPVGRWRENEE